MAITSDRDKVRLHIGDTNESDPLLYDDEIDALLTARTLLDSDGGTLGVNVQAAAADGAGAIAAKYARNFDFSTDGQGFSLAQRVGHYQTLERSLRQRAGGISAPLSLAGTETT